MNLKHWWTVAVIGTAVVLSAILAYGGSDTWQLEAIGFGAIAVFVASWFALGMRCGESTPGAYTFLAITILFAGAVTLANPSLAIVQCIAFPLVWTRLMGVRESLILNVVLAASVGTGMYFSTGADENSLLQVAAIEGISLAFSFGLGLWITSIVHQSIERQRLLDALTAAQSELALLNRDAGVTSERERLAREIHDTIAQDLTGIVLIAQRASRELGAGSTDAAAEQLAMLEENARTALAETRALVAASAPPGLEAGLAAAIARLATRFERETGIAVSVESTGTVVDRDTEVVLLRCAQEGLANVRKHSGATTVTMTVSQNSLTVCDNGRGFDTADESAGFGLAGMRDRLALVGGTIDVSSGATGTTLTVIA